MESEDNDLLLYSKTKKAFDDLLDLNMSPEELHQTTHNEPFLVWRVLILDDYSNLAMAPIMHVGNLRLHNVTLYLPLHSERKEIHSVTAIYVVEPTQLNIERIIQDCRANLYEHFQINFIHPPRQVALETLGAGLVAENSVGKLLKVYEQYLKFVPLEDQLFISNYPSFETLQQPGKPDEEIEDMLGEVATSLFCVLRTCNVWPIIQAGKGMSEIVAHKLAELCWSHSKDSSQLSRPLLLILDRSVDFPIMFHHGWTYQALAFDVFRNSLNKVVLPGDPPQVHELDKSRDEFWKHQSSEEFSQVLQNIDKHFNEWKQTYDQMGSNISEAFEKVSRMTEVKSQLDLHMNMATQLVNEAKSRHLDYFNQAEELLMQGRNSDINELLQKTPGENSSYEDWEKDKLRLETIAYLCHKTEDISDPALKNYLQSLRGEAEQQSALKSLAGFAGKMKEKLIGQERMLPVTKLLHSAMENRSRDLVYYDSMKMDAQKYKKEFSEAIVFVVGGGCYSEYHNLMHYSQKFSKNILYGSTEMCSPKDFLKQLQNLSQISY